MATKTQDNGQLAAQRDKLSPPKMYKVVLLNDDYTPMDFVINVRQRFFSMDTEQATRIMLQVHNEGRGVCGIFPRDIAATKVEQVLAHARPPVTAVVLGQFHAIDLHQLTLSGTSRTPPVSCGWPAAQVRVFRASAGTDAPFCWAA